MTKQTRSKIAEVVLVLAFCIISIYITLVGTVFVGIPPLLTQSAHLVAQRMMSWRPCIKKTEAVDEKLAPSPCSSDGVMRVIQMEHSPGRYAA
jgi:hypothetical protein